MKHVVTLTMNPAIDKSATAAHIIAEQKIRCENIKFEPGGGGINVSRAIKKLGDTSLAVFPAGGHSGELLKKLLSDEDIAQAPVSVNEWTRENFIVVDSSTNQQFRFGMPGHTLSEAEADNCLDFLRNLSPKPEFLVASGSLPPGLPSNFFAKVARVAKEIGAKFILDTSGEPLREAANEGVYLLKPNLGELSKLAGVDSLEMDMVDDVAREIIAKGNCEVVVVSLGPAGAMLVTADIVEHILAPPVLKKSTVGAGDSMVAGMVWSLAQEKSHREMIRFGVACGTGATMNTGTELFRKADVEKLYQWILAKCPL